MERMNTKNYILYEVGGRVRDELLGLKSNDVDYSVVILSGDLDIEEALESFQKQLEIEGYEIFLVTPDCFTIRAKFPKGHVHSGVADFVLARQEMFYMSNSRKPISILGTLKDDLRRRDFTVNAMAKSENGNIIDYFNGKKDLNYMILNTPDDPSISFMDDPLRIIRGMRFCITKGFTFSDRVRMAIRQHGLQGLEVVSHERIREELYKCFKFNTVNTLRYLNYMEKELNYPLMEYAFKDTGIWLEPTAKT